MSRLIVRKITGLAVSVLMLGIGTLNAQSLSTDAGEASLFEVIGDPKSEIPAVSSLPQGNRDAISASSEGSAILNATDANENIESFDHRRPANELDFRIPLETTRLAEEFRPLVVASQPAYCAIARRIGAGRFNVQSLPSIEDSSTQTAIDPSIVSLVKSARLVLVDDLGQSAQRRSLLAAVEPSAVVSINAIHYPQRPGGQLKIHDIAAGANWDTARWLSQSGESPEPAGGRLSDAIMIAWSVAEAMTRVDPDADQLYFDRAWALTTQFIELRALAVQRFLKLDSSGEFLASVEFWVTDGYALALAADIGLPVGRWVDPALLATPSGERLEQLVAAGKGKRIIVLRSTPDAGTEIRRAPISPTLTEKLNITDIYVSAFRTLCEPTGDYLRTQAANYDVIYRAVAPAEGPQPKPNANARTRGDANENKNQTKPNERM